MVEVDGQRFELTITRCETYLPPKAKDVRVISARSGPEKDAPVLHVTSKGNLYQRGPVVFAIGRRRWRSLDEFSAPFGSGRHDWSGTVQAERDQTRTQLRFEAHCQAPTASPPPGV